MRIRIAHLATAAGLVACADPVAAPSAPDPDPFVAAAASSGQTTAVSADTTRPVSYPPSVRVSGRVLTTVWTPGRTVGDTVSGFAPVSGARVTLYRNVLVDGRGVSQLVGERTTGADGAFVFEGAPGGPYVLALNVTPGRPYGEALTYVMGTAVEVTADLRVWTGGVAADSSR